MSVKLLQLNFTFTATPIEYQEAVAPLANEFARIDGLRWKIWLMNEETRKAGGLYLFEDGESLEAFLTGPLAAAVKRHPAVRDLDAKTFDVMQDLTAAPEDRSSSLERRSRRVKRDRGGGSGRDTPSPCPSRAPRSAGSFQGHRRFP